MSQLQSSWKALDSRAFYRKFLHFHAMHSPACSILMASSKLTRCANKVEKFLSRTNCFELSEVLTLPYWFSSNLHKIFSSTIRECFPLRWHRVTAEEQRLSSDLCLPTVRTVRQHELTTRNWIIHRRNLHLIYFPSHRLVHKFVILFAPWNEQN